MRRQILLKGNVTARACPSMSKLGMPPMEAIRSATIRPAEMLGLQGEIGVIAPGAYADIIAVRGNPLAHINELGRVVFVMKGGRMFVELPPESSTPNPKQ